MSALASLIVELPCRSTWNFRHFASFKLELSGAAPAVELTISLLTVILNRPCQQKPSIIQYEAQPQASSRASAPRRIRKRSDQANLGLSLRLAEVST